VCACVCGYCRFTTLSQDQCRTHILTHEQVVLIYETGGALLLYLVILPLLHQLLPVTRRNTGGYHGIILQNEDIYQNGTLETILKIICLQF